MRSIAQGCGHSLRSWLLALSVLAVPLRPEAATAARAELRPGVQATFSASGATETEIRPALALYVPAGAPPSASVPAGGFSALWSGYISSELRGQYAFQAELNGSLRLEINGQVVLEDKATNSLTKQSTFVRLNKGTNLVTAVFESPPQGDAMFRLAWIPKGSAASPIPAPALSCAALEPGVQKTRAGHELFIEYRCARCHAVPPPGPRAEAPSPDAPSFEGIGSRRNFDWLKRWILNPRAERPSARMPQVLHGPSAEADALATAAFLASLVEDGGGPADGIQVRSTEPAGAKAGREQIEGGQRLFESLHCAACHDSPESLGKDPDRVSLRHVLRKFKRPQLAAYLLRPEAGYNWTRMPNFHLAQEEAGQIAAYLLACAEPAGAPSPAPAPELAARGKEVVQTRGCLNCHSLRLENRFAAQTAAGIARERLQSGCLSADPGSAAPRFAFSAGEREALAMVLQGPRSGLGMETAAEFAQRQIQGLRCAECHGKFDGFPSLEMLAGKLRPEWFEELLSGRLPYRPRPWLSARMPAFPAFARRLAQGFAMLHGHPPLTPPEPAVDLDAAEVGRKLVSAEGGFSCIACHAVGGVGATQVFENAGINLACGAARLLKPYYQRWVRNPLAIDPVSKMPVFFDEEFRSPLAEFYDGDGARQIEAIWQYMRLGEKMPPPPGAAPKP